MKRPFFALFSLLAMACSPIPDLAGVFQVPDADGGSIGDMGDHNPRKPEDMGMTSGTAPCPTAFGATASFCYWLQGQGDLSIATALSLVTTDPNCALMAGRLSVNAASLTCSVAFADSVSKAWGFSSTKAAYVAFSYSMKMPVDHAILSVDMPSGSTNEVIQVNGIASSQNVINLYSPIGTMFGPGFNVALAGSAKRATVSFDWISVWQ